MADKVFVSYRADDEGTKHKNLLVAWSANDYFSQKLNFMIPLSEFPSIRSMQTISNQ